ncbi:MAG: glucose-6-phosphate isomerase [Bacteroidetes bacterium]|nr:glucose-6-phosphate isomerase [Bacteroidota bacterium]
MEIGNAKFIIHSLEYNSKIKEAVSDAVSKKVASRIWEKDYTLWSNEPAEITNRLAWLNSPSESLSMLDEIISFRDEIIDSGFKNVLLLGMGGSSLAPEVFSKIFGKENKFLNLEILDSTDPGAVLALKNKFNPKETLYIVSTKSGGTVETISFMKYFFNYAVEKLGDEASNHFIAITDPGSGLQQMAEDLNFRNIFLNNPDIGGRYSALSLFGMVPAALIGIDLQRFLANTQMLVNESAGNSAENSSLVLGVLMGLFAAEKKDKLTFVLSDEIKFFGSWVEQLVAESTGKIGKGILPVDREELLSPEYYSDDRFFVNIRLKKDISNSEKISTLIQEGHPVIEIVLDDIYDLAKELYRWEFATAVTGWFLNIQPFDQPNVESAKIIARQMVKEYQEKGELFNLSPSFIDGEIEIYGESDGGNIKEIFWNYLDKNLKQNRNDGLKQYVSIQAYVNPIEQIDSALLQLQSEIQKKYKCAVTTGFGPRFLHSTGQLHKGDAGNGVFVQFTSKIENDTAIPNEAKSDSSSISFGVLREAQALGDRQALLDNNRPVLKIRLSSGLEKDLLLLF